MRELLSTWYRSLTPDGKLWAEGSEPEEILTDKKPGLTFQKKETYRVSDGWKDINP